MDVVWASVEWQFVTVYIGNIAIFSKSSEHHIPHTDEFSRLLMDAGKTLKLKQCHVFGKFINYFRHVAAPDKGQRA